jgi:hypothetical protein
MPLFAMNAMAMDSVHWVTFMWKFQFIPQGILTLLNLSAFSESKKHKDLCHTIVVNLMSLGFSSPELLLTSC